MGSLGHFVLAVSFKMFGSSTKIYQMVFWHQGVNHPPETWHDVQV